MHSVQKPCHLQSYTVMYAFLHWKRCNCQQTSATNAPAGSASSQKVPVLLAYLVNSTNMLQMTTVLFQPQSQWCTPESRAEPEGTAMGAHTKPTDEITFRLPAARLRNSIKPSYGASCFKTLVLHQRAGQPPWPNGGRIWQM